MSHVTLSFNEERSGVLNCGFNLCKNARLPLVNY